MDIMALVQNKKTGLEFKIQEKLVFGIELLGPEVKSLRKSQGSLDGARVIVKNGQLLLIGAFIPIYQERNNPNLDAYRIRTLLGTRSDIMKLATLGTGSNLHFFPVSLFVQGRLVKLEVGIGTKLQKHDKREVIKKRDLNRKG
jgi:SsrA-binding protein